MSSYLDIYINRGADFNLVANLKDSNGNPVSLAGVSQLDCQFRRDFGSTTSWDVTATVDNITQGRVRLSLSGASSGSMRYGTYLYDVLATETNGDLSRLLEGRAEITPSVTR